MLEMRVVLSMAQTPQLVPLAMLGVRGKKHLAALLEVIRTKALAKIKTTFTVGIVLGIPLFAPHSERIKGHAKLKLGVLGILLLVQIMMANLRLLVKETLVVLGLEQRVAHLMEQINQLVRLDTLAVLGTAELILVAVFMMRRLHAQANTIPHVVVIFVLELSQQVTALGLMVRIAKGRQTAII